MTNKAVRTEKAPKALGPYSQGIDAGEYVFVSGQVGIDAASGQVREGIAGQAEQALRNVGAVLEAAGCGWRDVVKVTLWLTLPRGFLISVEAIAKRAS